MTRQYVNEGTRYRGIAAFRLSEANLPGTATACEAFNGSASGDREYEAWNEPSDRAAANPSDGGAGPVTDGPSVDSLAEKPAPRARAGRRKPPPARVGQRPDPNQWGEDELLTLQEAAALLWPAGPLTGHSLRVAVRDGVLAVAVVAGRFLTTRRALGEMGACSRRGPR